MLLNASVPVKAATDQKMSLRDTAFFLSLFLHFRRRVSRLAAGQYEDTG